MSSRGPYISPLPNIRFSRILRRIGIPVAKAGREEIPRPGQSITNCCDASRSMRSRYSKIDEAIPDHRNGRPPYWLWSKMSPRYASVLDQLCSFIPIQQHNIKKQRMLWMPGIYVLGADLRIQPASSNCSRHRTSMVSVCVCLLKPLTPRLYSCGVPQLLQPACHTTADSSSTCTPLSLKHPDSLPYVPTSSPAYPKECRCAAGRCRISSIRSHYNETVLYTSLLISPSTRQ